MTVWDQIEEVSNYFKHKLIYCSKLILEDNDQGWENYVFQNDFFRRSHLQIVDFRKNYKMYILHLTVFPHVNNRSPIFGFDVVSGENKITGVFHDFSIICSNEYLMKNWFEEESKKYQWNKTRTLPEWAQKIFSPNMIAVGNVRIGSELDDVCDFAKKSLDYYLDNLSLNASYSDYTKQQNNYCHYQKQNPHVINSMVSMGIQKEKMQKFVDEILFPESHTYQYAK